MPARILYVTQSATLKTSDGTIYNLPVQSANCEVTRPVEDVLTMGRLTSLGRIQNSVSTCKADLKVFLDNKTGSVSNNNTVTATLVNQLTGDALSANLAVITVSPNGFTMSGILTNLGLEAANGAFATANFSFAGVGDPLFAAAPTNAVATTEGSAATITAISPVNGASISGSATLGCINSIKFSLDIPNDVISCLGSNPSGSQSAVAANYLIAAKPPFKTSIAIEGAGADPVANSNTQTFVFGKLGVLIPNPLVVNQSFNQAVGNVAANYSYTIEGVSATFSEN